MITYMVDPPIQPTTGLPDRWRCRAIREAAGLSRPALAARVGCSLNAVVQWERGERTVSGKYLIAYLNLLAELEREAELSKRAATGL